MKSYSVLILLITIHFVYCSLPTDTDNEAPSTDLAAQEKPPAYEKPLLSNSLESMWTAVRQHIGNLNLNTVPKFAEADANNVTAPSVNISREEVVKDVKKDEDEQDNLPSQMEPLEKALIYTRPKADERWILNEEGLVTWAVATYLESKASSIYMNCNLYLDDKMLLSVFKGVSLGIGTESWRPPLFLKPSPNYRLRLWSQPSPVGIIDEYSPLFSIVARKQDAFMFDYNKSVILNNNNNNNNNRTNGGLVPTRKIKVGHNDLPAPTVSESHGMVINNPFSSSLNPNMPTGIYVLYPSGTTTSRYVNIFSSGISALAITILFF